MGHLSLERLFPEYFGNPDDSVPIRSLGLPSESAVMRAGFEKRAPETIVFEGETPVKVHFCERLWQFTQLPDRAKVRKVRRWRLELLVSLSEAKPIKAGSVAVVAQEPYSNIWIQRPRFAKYSSKSDLDRPSLEVPELQKDEDPVEWLERNATYDPWERNKRFVAGISSPRGFMRGDDPRNSSGDFILGACPDFDAIVTEIFNSPEIQHLLHETRANRIRFWFPGKEGDNLPKLYEEVIDACETHVLMAIQQALAGPSNKPGAWLRKPVWKLADWIYRTHLNNHNRAVQRRHEGGSTPTTDKTW